MLLVKIFIFYIKFTIFIANIDVVLFILLTGIRCSVEFTSKSLLKISNLHLSESFNIYFDSTRSNRQVPQNVIEPIRILPTEDEFTANEHWHIVKDHLGNWHIGLVFEVELNGSIALCADVLVSSSLFFRFPMNSAKQYLIEIAEDDYDSVILAADLHHNIIGSRLEMGDIYDLPDLPLIIKTYWIQIIQRTWKRVYKERMRILMLRGSLQIQRRFEISGKYDIEIGQHDRLKGMLNRYEKNIVI